LKILRHTSCTSCGGTSVAIQLDRPIMKDLLDKLVGMGFVEATHFTAAGLLYMEDMALILTGPFGSDRLQVKCKIQDCEKKINDLEALLQQME